MSARVFVASNGAQISIGEGSTITVSGTDSKVADVDTTSRFEVLGHVKANVNGKPVAVCPEGPVPRTSKVPLGIQAARAQAAAKYRQMKQQQQQKEQQKEQAQTAKAPSEAGKPIEATF